MESPGNSNGQRTISGSPGRAEQGVAGIPPGMDAHLSGAPCQSGCQGFVGQGLSAGSFQQGFLNFDPWANWINQRQFLQSTAFVAATVERRSECTCATVCE